MVNDSVPWKDITKGLLTLLAILAICAAALGLFIRFAAAGLASLCNAMGSLDVAIVVALITGTISIMTVVVGGIASNNQRKQYYPRQHREAPYQKLVEMVYKMVAKGKNPESYSETELISDFNEFSQALTLWGSPKAIKQWNGWRQANTGGISDPEKLLFTMERIMMQLRADMGKKGRLKKGDLLKLFINDLDDYLLSRGKMQ